MRQANQDELGELAHKGGGLVVPSISNKKSPEMRHFDKSFFAPTVRHTSLGSFRVVWTLKKPQ